MNSSENKNLILAMSLMLAVWLGFSILFPPVKQEQVTPTEPPAADQATAETAAPTITPGPAKIQPLNEAGTVSPAVTDNSVPGREITIETDKYQAVFTTQGARLVSFKLKDYKATAAEDAPPVQMFESGPLRYATLRTTGTEGFVLNEDARFETASANLVEINGDAQYELRFKHVAANGMQYVKTYRLLGDRYTIDTTMELANTAATPLRGSLGFALVQHWDENQDSNMYDMYSFIGPATLNKEEIEEVDVDDLKEGSVAYGADVSWTSFQTKYFLSVVVPGTGSSERIEIRRKGDAVENLIETPVITLQPGERKALDYLVFIGPKDAEQLKAAGHNLDKVVHFGFFNILAQPLFLVLTFFYGYFKNYGVAIILLTVLIKIIFWPLTHKSYSSMKAMQKLQPEMQKLREKHSGDKERLNKEMMALYKTHSVNPLGGCLPMLVQIPVFFALYKVLLDSIALRHADFAFWLTDLSAKDPYYITPVLMGASMFVQQKMTPTTADPMQAKIFMMMPIIFTFMFLNFPSGLVIYWLVNNLLTILQQYFIHRKKA
ncbi:MAG: membrane protein insertase YidC [Deltaproteobacteria bacterium]|nr:membrane protein insertase YidC [Deltaproteobacteria bacterium]MDH4006646.1 membrane protein insertase YidC [Desulfuromonadales bacterium]